ncbi:MAG: hypothetical protein IKF91_00750 [Bacilli bacterium]|nr:hypothetical protein [Bacilli bacterium]
MKRNLLKAIGISFLIFVILSWIIPVGTYTSGKLSTSGISPVGLGDLFNKPISAVVTFALYGVVLAVIGGFYGVVEETGALEKVVGKLSNSFEENSTFEIFKKVLKYLLFLSIGAIVAFYLVTVILHGFDDLFKGNVIVNGLIFGTIIFGALLVFLSVLILSTLFVKKENKFLVLTIVLFILLSSLTGLVVPLFVLVPLFAAALFKLNYDKVTVLAATVGSLLLGSVASTYGFNITGYTKNLLSLDMNFQIVPKIIILVLLILLFSLWIVRNSKKVISKKTISEKANLNMSNSSKIEDKKEVKKPAIKKNTSKKMPVKKNSTKKTTPRKAKGNTKALAVISDVLKVGDNDHIKGRSFIVLLVIMLIVIVLGMYNWYYSFNIDVFNKIHEAVMGVKIKDFAIFEKLFSGISQFGYWSNIEFASLLIVTSMVIALIYKLSVNEYVESFISGVKKWIPTAIYSTLASVILVILYQSLQSGSGSIVNTICAKIFDLVDGFNPIVTGFASLIGSFFFNDLYYLLATMTSFVSGYKGVNLNVAGLVIQSVYGVAMMIFPTSALLISGLSLFDVSYKEWIKYIWKFILITLLIVLIICSIVVLL